MDRNRASSNMGSVMKWESKAKTNRNQTNKQREKKHNQDKQIGRLINKIAHKQTMDQNRDSRIESTNKQIVGLKMAFCKRSKLRHKVQCELQYAVPSYCAICDSIDTCFLAFIQPKPIN